MAVQWQRWGSTIHFIWNDTMIDRDRLAAMLIALDASPRTLRRPVCRGWVGDWQIIGRYGHIIPDGPGFLIYVATDESPRRWGFVKQRLEFCRVTQDGDDEGCLRLDRLPTQTEADAIREAIGVKRRRHLSPEALAEALAGLERARGTAGRHHQPQGLAKAA
jgi:hypothetical protein